MPRTQKTSDLRILRLIPAPPERPRPINDIVQALQEMGVNVSHSYVYQVLQRFREEDLIRASIEEGRDGAVIPKKRTFFWYLTEKGVMRLCELEKANGTEPQTTSQKEDTYSITDFLRGSKGVQRSSG